jgi:hypothetical protein
LIALLLEEHKVDEEAGPQQGGLHPHIQVHRKAVTTKCLCCNLTVLTKRITSLLCCAIVSFTKYCATQSL